MDNKSLLQNRVQYDLSHFSMTTGAIGCLQTLAAVPVVAGDSMELNLEAVFRLSPLRRPLYLDSMIDLFAFFVPHRHVYGNTDWINFIRSGVDEGVTFGTHTLNATTDNHCLGTHIYPSTTIAKFYMAGYAKIWNRYFKHPGDADMVENFFVTDTSKRNYYGQYCCYPKRMWNTGRIQEVDSSDTQYSCGAGPVVDLIDFAKQQGRYKSELKREWFGQRYTDLMGELWGSTLDENVEQIPELIARETHFLSGYETDGTSSDSMGLFQARSVGTGFLRFPMKFFNEHGMLWIMALVRFPPVLFSEIHFLSKPGQSEPTYKQIAGDPDIIANEGLDDLTGTKLWYNVTDATVLGRQPYGWWYREHPNFVHTDYIYVNGHPMRNEAFVTDASAKYYNSTDQFDDIFSTTQLKHWSCQAHVGLNAKRLIPDPRAGIFAGTR